MTNESSLTVWENKGTLEEVRKLFAPTLTESEFQFFVGLGKATKLNPFAREIWCVKYKEGAAAQVFVGRDGYRKAAQSHPEYDFHQCDAVYQNDKFSVINGEVQHSYTLNNRGNLVGAYCLTKRKTSSKPMYVFSELKEYSTGKSLWNSQGGKPATMIKKVAESQCLRACFQDMLGGTYGEEEMDKSPIRTTSINSNNVIDISPIPSDNLLADDVQKEAINKLFLDKKINELRVNKAFEYYGVNSLENLTYENANDFIYNLQKIKI